MTTPNNILLCPGQGAQHVGMGKDWAEASSLARQLFAESDRLLGFDLSRICFEGPEDQLNRTDIAQPAIFLTSVACYRVLQKHDEMTAPVAAAAGLSLGEFTALHLAGAFDFETGLKLVRLRGKLMQQAAERTPSGMVALVGADEQQAYELCEQVLADPTATADEVIVPANFNCPGQVVISGTLASCQRALGIAETMGIRATPLKVAGAFHSPLMQPAADELAEALDHVSWSKPSIPVVSNVDAEPHDNDDPDSIKQLLVKQLTNPVRWTQSMQWMIGNVPGQMHELAPGKVLAGLMRRIDRKTRVQTHAQP